VVEFFRTEAHFGGLFQGCWLLGGKGTHAL